MQPQNLPVLVDMLIRNHTKHFSAKNSAVHLEFSFLSGCYRTIQKHAPKQFTGVKWTYVKAVIYSCKHAAHPWYVNCCLPTVLLSLHPVTRANNHWWTIFLLFVGSFHWPFTNKNLLLRILSITPLDIIKCCTLQLRNLANLHAGNKKIRTSHMRCYRSIAASHGEKK